MIGRGSRYRNARRFTPREEGGEAFAGIRPREIGLAVGVVEHRVTAGERLDLLARHYYNDDRLWWRIADANPRFLYAGDMVLEADDPDGSGEGLGRESMVGSTILIPKARE